LELRYTQQLWMVENLKLKMLVAAESVLEGNKDSILLRRMIQDVPLEILQLNLLWVFDKFSNDNN
jgi:hypothetical protein